MRSRIWIGIPRQSLVRHHGRSTTSIRVSATSGVPAGDTATMQQTPAVFAGATRRAPFEWVGGLEQFSLGPCLRLFDVFGSRTHWENKAKARDRWATKRLRAPERWRNTLTSTYRSYWFTLHSP